FSCSTRVTTAKVARCGLFASSERTSLIRRPFTPPASLTSEKAAIAPRQSSTPRPIDGPLNGAGCPRTTLSSVTPGVPASDPDNAPWARACGPPKAGTGVPVASPEDGPALVRCELSSWTEEGFDVEGSRLQEAEDAAASR